MSKIVAMNASVWQRRAWVGIGAGLGLGALGAAGIFWVPQEPRPAQVFCAAALKGALTGLLLAGVLSEPLSWVRALLGGAVLGGLMGLVVALAKGYSAAPYVVQASVIEGLLLGAILKKWGR
ncbi:MAG: hypothetical protein HYY26_01125 [Acidobacteria bacterium]|nr:hypothetical protein [Acidobacteriota bacterium]